tara:strand:+ start:123 stop:1145 length:1023 start_codon:yes stop_codon:yes gene_type:complete
MKYRVHLTEKQHGRLSSDGSNYITQYIDGDNIVEWELMDNICAETFVTAFNMVKGVDESRANELSPASWIAWNRYSTGEDTSSDWQNSIELLNLEVMYAIDKGHCDFKQNKHIIRSDVMDMDEILSICNAIHFEFESKLLDHQKQLQEASAPDSDNDFKECLEKLNRLVHLVEKGPNINTINNNFFVIRYNSDHVSKDFPKLNDDMYKCFQQNVENGDLFSDFFTVGKDLGHAYHTKDIELVKNKECKQQSVISGAVHFGFNPQHFGNKDSVVPSQVPEYANYQNWCKEIQADQYGYNYWEPKYNLGRAPIGSIIDESYESLLLKFNETPYISKVELVEN